MNDFMTEAMWVIRGTDAPLVLPETWRIKKAGKQYLAVQGQMIR